MALPWKVLDTVATDEGELQLRVRGDRDYMITIDGRVLMVSQSHLSEQELARLAQRALGPRKAPRVLIGGLGLGYTLRTALDMWPADARLVVCEITPAVVRWCRGPLAPLTGGAVADPRVQVLERDVAHEIRDAARRQAARRYDAILLDLYEGPNDARRGANLHLYGKEAIETARRALRAGGIFAVWSEAADVAFERRLSAAKLRWTRHRPKGRGGSRHIVYISQRD